MDNVSQPAALRGVLCQQLHHTFARHRFDNWLVWAGNHTVDIDGIRYGAALARAYVGPTRPSVPARVRVELFVAAVNAADVRPGDVDARLWTDANRHGFTDTDGMYQDDPGTYHDMSLVCDAQGVPVLAGNNLVFESPEIVLDTPGAYNYTVEFSAAEPDADGERPWVALNDMADNRNGVVVVTPEWVADCPTVAEVCARKTGAARRRGKFQSGRFRAVTEMLEQIPADVVYLLPFFEPGFLDVHTGEDVRKGRLGSPYAVRDFFRLDPQLVSPLAEVDVAALVAEGLIEDADMAPLGLSRAEQLAAMDMAAAPRRERDALVQIIGRAELRQLTRRAHELGKRVIFDLVLMQTSRDSPLIEAHPEWYVLDEGGVPRIHQIAWLVYSDVALFDLVFNWPLQNYLLGVAPYWMEQCGFDGVRIDASQTVDRPFLKKIKNRINAVRPDGLVLGETLCPLDQALDIPVDMVYALLVDFHRDVDRARPLIDFLEQMHARFAPRTVAMAYFENHDSPRATRIWRERYDALLPQDEGARAWWQERGGTLSMALLKNLQASLLDLSAGLADGSNLAGGLELGSWWGEEARTDFENETLLDPEQATRLPQARLAASHARLDAARARWPELRRGRLYYYRNELAGGDAEDRVFGYVRYTGEGALLVVHSFDPAVTRRVAYSLTYLPWTAAGVAVCFDTYEEMALSAPSAVPRLSGGAVSVEVLPLQSLVVRLEPAPRKAGPLAAARPRQ